MEKKYNNFEKFFRDYREIIILKDDGRHDKHNHGEGGSGVKSWDKFQRHDFGGHSFQ